MPPKEIETKRLSEIVLDMLATGASDSEILINLQQSGLTKQKARDVLEKAKEEFKEFTGKRIEGIIEKVTSEKIEKKLAEIKKDLSLQSDLKFIEHKKYIDKKIEEVRTELSSLKAEVGDLRVGTEAALKRVLKEMDTLKISTSTQRYLSITLIIGGIFSSILFFTFAPRFIDYLYKRQPFDFNAILNLILLIFFALIAFICFRLGGKVYTKSKKKFAEVEFWKKEEEKST